MGREMSPVVVKKPMWVLRVPNHYSVHAEHLDLMPTVDEVDGLEVHLKRSCCPS